MEERKYIRDKRSPKPKSEAVSKVMSANKGKGTKPEISVRKTIWKHGLRGYRVNVGNIPGKPDIAFINRKVAIFINGCYWHRCPYCNLPNPKNNPEFWQEKFSRNIARDKSKKQILEGLGWRVIIIWECEVKKDIETAVDKIINVLGTQH